MKLFVFLSAFVMTQLFSSGLMAQTPCESETIKSTNQAFEEASIVLVGRVMHLSELNIKGVPLIEIGVTFSQVFKGQNAYVSKLQKIIKLVMPFEEANGRQRIRVGSNYVFYAQEDSGLQQLLTTICWGNREVNDMDGNLILEEIAALSSLYLERSKEPVPEVLPEVIESEPQD